MKGEKKAMKNRVILSGYAGAPEMSAASVNGQRVNISGTAAAYYIACRDLDKARAEVMRIYRAEWRKPKKYIYAFQAINSRQFYYITALYFRSNADIKTRLYCYKELKHHLQTYAPTITTETGHITPAGATKPHTTTETVKLDFSKALKIRIKEA